MYSTGVILEAVNMGWSEWLSSKQVTKLQKLLVRQLKDKPDICSATDRAHQGSLSQDI